MPSTKAIIRENKVNSKGECVIYIRYGHAQKSVDITTGIKVKPESWNKEKQIVNSLQGIKKTKGNENLVKELTKSDLHANSIIDHKKAELIKLARSFQQEEIEPEVHLIKEKYLNKKNKLQAKASDYKITILFNEFIKNSNKSRRTILNYGTALYHLEEFEKHIKRSLTINRLNIDTIDEFSKYLLTTIEKKDGTKGLSDNTVSSTIKNIKVFLTYLVKRGFEVEKLLSNIKVTYVDTPIYFLTEDEIDILINFEFQKERLERVRDLFVLNCYLGLRYSDLSRLSKDHINDDVIQLRAFKNQKDVYIPIIPQARTILEKYDYQLPRISEQKFNEYIKEACKIAKLNKKVEKIKSISGNKSYEMVPKHEVISSHIAIKTFISLCAIKGISPKVVAEITGKTVKVILKHYYGIDKSTIKDQMKAAFQ